MKKTLLIFFTLLSFNFSATVNAQYSDYLMLPDMRTAVVNNIIFKDLYAKDFEVLKKNKVKSIKSMDESGNVQNELRLNEDGQIEYYSDDGNINYDERNREYFLTWEFGRMQKLIYKGTNFEWTYKLNYKNGFLDFIRLDFGGNSTMGQDYILKYENGKISELQYDDKYKDSVYLICYFLYDKKDRLMKVTTGEDNYTIDSIVYEGNKISFFEYKEVVKSYIIQEDRMYSELTNYPAPQPRGYNPDVEYPRFYTETKKYNYRANGLIEFIDNGYQGENGRISYVYEFYE